MIKDKHSFNQNLIEMVILIDPQMIIDITHNYKMHYSHLIS